MDLSIQDITEVRKNVIITLSAADIKEAEADVIQDFLKHARIPGFRPGKAPVARVRSLYADAIQDEIKRKLERKSFEKMNQAENLNICGIADHQTPSAFDVVNGNIITFVVDVVPTIKLPDYNNIPVEIPEVNVSEKEIEESIAAKQREHSAMEPVERGAAVGEYVKVTYIGTMEGASVNDVEGLLSIYKDQRNTWEKAGATEETGVKEIVEALVGMQPGDKKTVQALIGDDSENKDFVGKAISYEVEVHEVREQVLPELNSEFFKKYKTDTLEAFRKLCEKEIFDKKQNEQMHLKRDQVAKFIDTNVSFPLPETVVDQEVQTILKAHITRLTKMGIDRSVIEEHKDKFFDEAQRMATENVRMRFSMIEIAKVEKLELTKEELLNSIMRRAYLDRVSPDKIVKDFQDDSSFANEIRQETLVVKTLDFLCDKAHVTFTKDSVASNA